MAKKQASETKIVQLVAAPTGLLTKGVEASEGVEAVAAQHVLALGLTEDGKIVVVTPDELETDVAL